MLVFGFEGWDIFIVLGVALTLQMLNVNNYVLWLVVGTTCAFLLIIKRGKPAKAKELILGITRISLTTESFLAAASFQQTAH